LFKGGSFPLVPFSNRIKNAKFNFNELEYNLNQNAFPHAIHGHGYLSEWSIVERSNASAKIIYRHQPDDLGWPWSYEITQSIHLNNFSCIIELKLTNSSNSIMPFGFGIHPFFNFNVEIRLKFFASREWDGQPEDFPTKTKSIENNFNIRNGRALWKNEKTVCYENFAGKVKIIWPYKKKKITMKVDKIFNHLIVHVPKGEEYFCIEPVSHPTDGFNLMQVKKENLDSWFLAPNENINGLIELDLEK
jgi:aldose 1-epimerase